MRVAVLSAEAVPYSKTGGLGDVAGALPKALKQVGVDALLITPCYWQTKGEYLWDIGDRRSWVTGEGSRIRQGLLQRGERFADLSDRRSVAVSPRFDLWLREDYERFAFFCHAALALIERIGTHRTSFT